MRVISKKDRSCCSRLQRLMCLPLLVVFFSYNSFSQVVTDTLRLYYSINEVSADRHLDRIDSLIKAIGGKMVNIKVTGYADFLSGKNVNTGISKRRAEGVALILKEKLKPEQLRSFSCSWQGESLSNDNGSSSGDPINRRTDVVIGFYVERVDTEKEIIAEKVPVQKKEKKLEDLEKGESLSVAGLNFEPGRHVILRSAIPVLQNLLKTMQENPNLKIEIQGHICCQHEDGDGLDIDKRIYNLSESRAKAIYDFLVANKIDPARLSYKGFGHSKPKVYPERTPADEQANRRVEILVVEK